MEEEAEERPVLLELFSGTGCAGRAFRARGYDIISVDADPKARASITRDILDFDVAELGGRRVDTVWASPRARTTVEPGVEPPQRSSRARMRWCGKLCE